MALKKTLKKSIVNSHKPLNVDTYVKILEESKKRKMNTN